MITIVFFCSKWAIPPHAFQEHSPALCPIYQCTEFRPYQTSHDFWKSHSCWRPVLLIQHVTTTFIFTLFALCVNASWKHYTVNHPAAVLFHVGAAQKITFASVTILECFAVIWLWFWSFTPSSDLTVTFTHQHFPSGGSPCALVFHLKWIYWF